MLGSAVRFPLAALSLLAALCAPARGADSTFTRDVLAASGVPAEHVERYARRLERLAREFASQAESAADAQSRAAAIHAFLHHRVLTGTYRADTSNLATALDGGAFNCVSATALFLVLADQVGLPACAVSTPGHVWCRVARGGDALEVESTCPDWFVLAERYRGLPNDRVSAAMVRHRGRVPAGRVLSRGELLAVFHFNRGVTYLSEGRVDEALRANLRALTLDPHCRPACENFAAAAGRWLTRGEPAQSAGQRALGLVALVWKSQGGATHE